MYNRCFSFLLHTSCWQTLDNIVRSGNQAIVSDTRQGIQFFLFALSFNVATMEARTTRKLASSLSAPSPTTPISCRPIQATPQLPEHPVSKQQSCAQWMPCILASLGSRWTGQRKYKTSQFYTSPSCRVAEDIFEADAENLVEGKKRWLHSTRPDQHAR